MRTRSVVSHPVAGGYLCPSLKEVDVCHSNDCPMDCEVGQFSEWSACTKTCGGGERVRDRPILQAASAGGRSCPGLRETVKCSTHSCPVNCMATPIKWSTCSAQCGGGKMTGRRTITTMPMYGGLDCEHGVQVDFSKACNDIECTDSLPLRIVVKGFNAASFDAVHQMQLRHGIAKSAGMRGPGTVIIESVTDISSNSVRRLYESTESSSSTAEQVLVTTKVGCMAPCTEVSDVASLVLGVTSELELNADDLAVIPPDHPCNVGTHSCDEHYGECVPGDLVVASNTPGKHGAIQTHVNHTYHCQCNVGYGFQYPLVRAQNQCVRAPITVAGAGAAEWNGVYEQMITPINSRPQYSRLHNGSRDAEHQLFFDGGSWNFAKFNVKTNEIVPESVNYRCIDDGAFPPEQCKGVATPNRSDLVRTGGWDMQNDGVSPGPQLVFHDVKLQIDCQVSPWSAWVPNTDDASGVSLNGTATCSKRCGGGSQVRTRTISVPAINGGNGCQERSEVQNCNEDPCPVDCVLGSFGVWSGCTHSCGGGMRTRKREVILNASNGGMPCDEELLKPVNETCAQHDCPVHCTVNSWAAWGGCTTSCGTGERTRSRKIAIEPLHGGLPCPPLNSVEECSDGDCPVDCLMGEWSDWGDCSVTCGIGLMGRTRNVSVTPVAGGAACPLDIAETKSCSYGECTAECEVTDWGSWSGACSHSCGPHGRHMRSRSVLSPPDGAETDISQCPPLLEERHCNEHACPTDCVMTEWSEFGTCSAECGGGTRTRHREVAVEPVGDGESCPTRIEGEPCNDEPCGCSHVRCEIMEWVTDQRRSTNYSKILVVRHHNQEQRGVFHKCHYVSARNICLCQCGADRSHLVSMVPVVLLEEDFRRRRLSGSIASHVVTNQKQAVDTMGQGSSNSYLDMFPIDSEAFLRSSPSAGKKSGAGINEISGGSIPTKTMTSKQLFHLKPRIRGAEITELSGIVVE